MWRWRSCNWLKQEVKVQQISVKEKVSEAIKMAAKKKKQNREGRCGKEQVAAKEQQDKKKA